jgi:transmembrane sensor
MTGIHLLNRSMLLLLAIGCWCCNGKATDRGQSGVDSFGRGKIQGDTTVEHIDSGVYANGTAARKEYRLPDGTKLITHSGTVVRLSKGFNGKDRELSFEGEAIFEVSGDTTKPVIVHTRYLQIQAKGARFRVDAKAGDAGEEVDLLSGKLKVMKSYHSDTDNEPETIHAGEMVMINRDIDLMEKEKMDGSELKGWEGER